MEFLSRSCGFDSKPRNGCKNEYQDGMKTTECVCDDELCNAAVTQHVTSAVAMTSLATTALALRRFL